MAGTFRKLVSLIRPANERQQLHYLLESASPQASLPDRVLWLEKVMIWIRTASLHKHDFDDSTKQLHTTRLRFILHLLERNPQWRERVGATLASLVTETSALSLLSQGGLGQQRGFFAEASDRVLRQWLPRPGMESDLSEIFVRMFQDTEDAEWVGHIPPALMGQLLDLVSSGSGKQVFERWRNDSRDSFFILAARIGSLGTLPEVFGRLSSASVPEIPFLELSFSLSLFTRQSIQGHEDTSLRSLCLGLSEACRREVERVYVAMEHSGVSVALVYTLENLVNATRRVDVLLKLLACSEEEKPVLVTSFLSTLVRERLSQRTLLDLVRVNLHLLSRKVVERAGASGEHYITRSRAEYFQMWRAGLGGGALMVGTTLVKFFLGSMHLPLFFEGLFFSTNYAVSFVVLQLCGFTLATKQPSATASALAGKLRSFEAQGEVRGFVTEVCRMTRSQFSALLGNLTLLAPLAVILDVASYFLTGQHLIAKSTAHYVFHSLDPVRSFTIFMAVLTGFHLWLSSLFAGWCENWIVFRKVPEGLASSPRLIQVFGKSGAQKLGAWVLRNSSLLGGNISLGFLLGFTVIVGKFLGLPFLDVRHVTLSSASLVLAICATVGKDFDWTLLILPVLGVGIVGALNFLTSYALALFVASRAREVPLGVLRKLLRAVRVRLRNRPGDFFLPPREPKRTAAIS